MKLGIIGNGFVGSAVANGFKTAGINKFKNIPTKIENSTKFVFLFIFILLINIFF